MRNPPLLPKRKFIGTLLGAGLFMISSRMHGQAVLKPPFGLDWGDSPEKLISWATDQAMDITITLPGGKQELRNIQIKPTKGLLPNSTASSVEGKFLNGGLFELTVHYRDSSVSAATMEGRFNEMKGQLAREHGTFSPNQQRRAVEDQFVTRTQSFHRESLKGVFMLIAWTEVEDLLRKTKQARFSLIYRNDNFKSELEDRKIKE